jgi:hypothetical protein
MRISHRILMFVLVVSSTISATAAPRSDISAAMAAKTTQSIIDVSTIGTPQDVIVELDITERLGQETAALKALHEAGQRNELSNSEILKRQGDIVDETAELIKKTTDIVFPNGALGSNHVLGTLSHVPLIFVHVPNLEGLKQILSNPLIIKVSENRQAKQQGTQNYQLIDQPLAIAKGKQGENTRVAVLDAGFSIDDSVFSFIGANPACRVPSDAKTTADLVGTGNCRIHDAVNFVSPGIDFCTTCDTSDSHGQSVAYVVAAMAPKTQISALQVVNLDGDTNTFWIASALNWVISNAKLSPPIVAVNISLSIQPDSIHSTACSSDQLASVMAKLISINIVPVVASGNGGNVFGVTSPACIPGVVAVGAVADSSTQPQGYVICNDNILLPDQVPCFSNGGSLLTLLAPGVLIQVPVNAHTGTFFAAPHVSGAVALLRGSTAFPGDATVSQTVARMTSTGKPVRDQRRYGVTTPRLQIDAALGLTVGRVGFNPPNCTNPASCR